MADNFGTLNPTTLSNSADAYLVRQNGIDYRQSRDDLAAGLSNARWTSTGNYLQHTPVIGSDGITYLAQANSGPDNGGAVDPTTDGDFSHWSPDYRLRVVEPLGDANVRWRLGMVQNTEGNPHPPTGNYVAGAEIAFNRFAGATGCTGVDVTDDGILFSQTTTDTIVYEYTLGGGNTITASDLTCHVKGDGGELFWLKDGESGVSITVAGGVATLEYDGTIFGALSINRIKEIGLQTQVGVFAELSEDETEREVRGGYIELVSGANIAHIHPSGWAVQYITRGIGLVNGGATVTEAAPLMYSIDYSKGAHASLVNRGADAASRFRWTVRDVLSDEVSISVSNATANAADFNFYLIVSGYLA